MRRAFAIFLIFTLLLITGCRRSDEYEKYRLTTATAYAEVENGIENGRSGFYDFTANLFTLSKKEGNGLIAPFSVYSAFGMAMSGAGGETLRQAEVALGGDLSTVNAFCLEASKKFNAVVGSKVSTVNSLWILDTYRKHIRDGYLDEVKSYYSPEVFSLPFDDKAIKNINNWAYNNTDGEIKKVINEINPLNRMFLINATVVEGKWTEQVKSTSRDSFFNLSGQSASAEYMRGSSALYETDGAYAVKKFLEGGVYLTAIMPKGDYQNYVSSFSGEEIASVLKNINPRGAEYKLPCFEGEFSYELIPTMKKLGMTDAFDSLADFSRMTSKNDLLIGGATMQTKINVDKNGLKASAVVKLEMNGKSASPSEEEPLYIEFNKPFLYMVVKDEIPLFLGCVESI